MFRTRSTNPMVNVDDDQLHVLWLVASRDDRRPIHRPHLTTKCSSATQFRNEATGSGFDTLAGSAIYEGPAIGQYAIPLAAIS